MDTPDTPGRSLAAQISSQTGSMLLEQAAASHPTGAALSYQGRTLTYRDVLDRVRRVADGLRRLGNGPGVPLGLLLPDSPSLVIYSFAAFAVGSPVVLFHLDDTEDDISDAITRFGLKSLVTFDVACCMDLAEGLMRGRGLETLVVLSYLRELPVVAAAQQRVFGGAKLGRVSSTPTTAVVPERQFLADSDKDAVLSAGSTPRAAVGADIAFVGPSRAAQGDATLTHAGLCANTAQILASLPPMTPGRERVMAAVRLSAPGVFTATVAIAFARACELIIAPEADGAGLAGQSRRARPTVLVTTQSRLSGLLSGGQLGPVDVGALKFTLALGGPVTPLVQQVYAKACAVPLIQSHILTGAAAIVALTPAHAAPAGSVGLPLIATRFVLRDLADPNRIVARGERGELYVQGPQLGVTAPGEPGPFVRSGDVAMTDGDGHLYLIDRVEDLIVAAGYLIYPRRIEDALLAHDGVEDAAVIAVSDGRRGQAPKAFIVLKRGVAVTERDLRLHLGERVSRIEMPADIDICRTLPRDPFGRPDKVQLRRGNAVLPP
jgi:long-chain acyl-CoA synthetase